MQQHTASLILLAPFVILGTPNVEAGEQCNNATLEGSYVARQSAFFFEDRQQQAALGVIRFDGKGNWSGAATFVGPNGVQRLTPSGTYTVNADCTGSGGPDLTFDLVIGEEGKEVFFIITGRTDRLVTWAMKKQFETKR